MLALMFIPGNIPESSINDKSAKTTDAVSTASDTTINGTAVGRLRAVADMLLKIQFVFFDFEEPLIFFLLDYASDHAGAKLIQIIR